MKPHLRYMGEKIECFDEKFVFQYIPRLLEQKQGSGWVEIKPPGLDGTINQFVHTEAREITLELFFNQYGDSTVQDNEPEYVENHISWLFQMITPIKTTGEFMSAPKRLFFSWGDKKFGFRDPGMICILTNVETTDEMFDPVTGKALRATIKITLRKDAMHPPVTKG